MAQRIITSVSTRQQLSPRPKGSKLLPAHGFEKVGSFELVTASSRATMQHIISNLGYDFRSICLYVCGCSLGKFWIMKSC